uniref:Uncharacterized protein n=1 Tax=Mycena chlorophos TaxID=658473 RepID=A0ABQ0MBI5_MYCCL|nr:predicted protein [Mycena chlorophos]
MFLYAVVWLAATRLASASLYPTFPVSDSVLLTDSTTHIAWIDTLSWPRLHDLGLLSIDICSTDGLDCVQVARGVSPMAREHSIHVPPDLSVPGLYAMLFRTTHPPAEFWTADFVVNGTTDTQAAYTPPGAQLDDVHSNPNSVISTAGASLSLDEEKKLLLTLVLPTTTLVSELPATTLSAASAAGTTISAGPVPKNGGGNGLDRTGSPSAGVPTRTRSERGWWRLAGVMGAMALGVSLA